MVSKIRFKNFKLFKEWQELEIKPITILIGKNNSGKSAVLKLPTMIAGSLLGENKTVIEFENNGIKLGHSYEDIFYNKDLNGEPLEFEINDGFVKAVITGNIEGDIRLLKYFFKGVEIDLTKNNVKGLRLDNEIFPSLNYDYIENHRKKPDFTNSKPFKDVNKIGVFGENSYDLFYSSFKSDRQLYNEVAEWYRQNFEGWSVQIDEVAGTNVMYEITLKNKSLKPINILNTGSGIIQSFPLVLRSFMKTEENTLIIIEEPESHLHPAAHGNLAQRFVESFLDDENKRFLIETHSKNFVLRMQSLVANPNIKFSKEDIAIYYVDFIENEHLSVLERLELDEFGEFKKWPEEIFNESYRELLLLKQNQSERDDSNNKS